MTRASRPKYSIPERSIIPVFVNSLRSGPKLSTRVKAPDTSEFSSKLEVKKSGIGQIGIGQIGMSQIGIGKIRITKIAS